MNKARHIERRQIIGRVSRDTKGPPGFQMDATGLWNKADLSR